MAGSISTHLSASSATAAAFTLAGAAAAAAGTVISRMTNVFSSANTDASVFATDPLASERVFSHAQILDILKREDVLANPNSPVQEWGIPPLLKTAELLVQFESKAHKHASSADHELAMNKPGITEHLKPLLKSSDPSIANAARKCMQAMDEGMHRDFPKELAKATKELIDSGADPLAPGIDGECALQKAAKVASWSIYPTVFLTMAHPGCRKLKKSDVDQLSIPTVHKDIKRYLYTIAFINALENKEDISAFGPLFEKGKLVEDRNSYPTRFYHLPSVLNPKGYYKGQSFLYYAVKHGRLDVIAFLRKKGAKLQTSYCFRDYYHDKDIEDPHYHFGYDSKDSPQIRDFFEHAAKQEDLYLFGALLDFVEDPAKREKKCRLFDERTENSQKVQKAKRAQRLAIHTGVAKTQEATTLPPQVLNQIGEHVLHLPRNPYAKDDTGPAAAASSGKEEAAPTSPVTRSALC